MELKKEIEKLQDNLILIEAIDDQNERAKRYTEHMNYILKLNEKMKLKTN